MSNYLDRLKALNHKKGLPKEVSKVAKAPFDTYDTDQSRRAFENQAGSESSGEAACLQPLVAMGGPEATRFSDLYATEADYARALIRYARQDGLTLEIRDHRLVISIGSKSDGDLLGELRAHETAVMDVLREGRAKGAISIHPAQPAEAFRPPTVRVPPFGCDAADLFSYWGLQLVSLGFTPGDVFDVPRHDKPGGLAWFVNGSPVMALGKGMAQLQDGRIWRRGGQ
jgi:hypothetical protein